MDERNGMNYPKRGEMSDDGRFYTHTDGSVHERLIVPSEGWRMCVNCSFFVDYDCESGRVAPCTEATIFKRIEGAYVTSAEEQEACDMARSMIVKCGGPESTRCLYYGGGYLCDDITNKSCPARAYLASHGDAHAWETNG